MKEKLLALLKKKEERKQELGKTGASTESVEELRSINKEIEMLNGEIAELRSMIDELPEDNSSNDDDEERRSQPQGQVNILGAYGFNQGQNNEQRSTGNHDSAEYRSAFMDYVTRGELNELLEFRADATTGTGDIGAIIPNTILNKIVEKMKDYGRIWSRVTQTSIQGGVQVPVSNAKPTATWVQSDKMSDKQKKEAKGTVTFSYHKLQCRVAVDLVAGTVSLNIFEQTISDNIYEAMVIALEEAIINGTGSGQPLGITKDTNIPSGQTVEVKAEDFGKYNKWTEFFGKVPRKYRNGSVLILADADWSKYIEGMTDSNGQPVARVNYGINGTEEERLLGKEVIPTEDYLPSIDDASEGDVVGIIVKLNDYMFNSNMQLLFKRYFNEDTDEWISKSTLIGDGKLSDRNGVILLKKATEA